MERDKKNTLIYAKELRVPKSPNVDTSVKDEAADVLPDASGQKMQAEINGPKGLEPTRYGDWEQKGRCTDF